MRFIKDRPVLFWGSLTTLVEAVIGLLLVFGLDLEPEQVGGIILFLAALGTMFVFIMQGLVTPTNNPKDDAGNMLTPATIGNDEADLPPILTSDTS